MRLGRRRKKKEKQRAAWDAVAATLEPPPPVPAADAAPAAPAPPVAVAPTAAPDAAPVDSGPEPTRAAAPAPESPPPDAGPFAPTPSAPGPSEPPPPSGPPVFRFTPSGATAMPTPAPSAPVVPLAPAPVPPAPVPPAVVPPAPVPAGPVPGAPVEPVPVAPVEAVEPRPAAPEPPPVGLTIAPPLPPSTPPLDVAAPAPLQPLEPFPPPEPPRAPEPHATLPVVYAPSPSIPGSQLPAPQLPPQTGRLVGVPASTRRLAERMRGAQQEMAQLSMRMDAWMDQAVEMRTQLLSEWDDDTLRPSYTDFVVRAVARALVQHPELNAIVRGDSIELLPRVHVGVTLPGGSGVEIPVVRDADRRTLKTIAAASRGFGEDPGPRALEGPDGEPAPTGGVAWHAPDDDAPVAPGAGASPTTGALDTDVMVDVPATFVVASLGMYGVDAFTPIVTSPNVATLAIGRVRDTTRWEGDHPTRAAAMTLTLAWDHRAVDGTTAAEFLAEVRDILEQPYRLLVD